MWDAGLEAMIWQQDKLQIRVNISTQQIEMEETFALPPSSNSFSYNTPHREHLFSFAILESRSTVGFNRGCKNCLNENLQLFRLKEIIPRILELSSLQHVFRFNQQLKFP